MRAVLTTGEEQSTFVLCSDLSAYRGLKKGEEPQRGEGARLQPNLSAFLPHRKTESQHPGQRSNTIRTRQGEWKMDLHKEAGKTTGHGEDRSEHTETRNTKKGNSVMWRRFSGEDGKEGARGGCNGEEPRPRKRDRTW